MSGHPSAVNLPRLSANGAPGAGLPFWKRYRAEVSTLTPAIVTFIERSCAYDGLQYLR
jgi:hypothetical protein